MKRPLVLFILFSAGALIALCQRAGYSDPASDYVKQGDAYYNDKKYPEAVSEYIKARTINPDDKAADQGIKRIGQKFYAKFMNEGFAALNSGLEAYKGKATLVRKDLEKALNLFTYAKVFETQGKTASGMAHYTKGIINQMNAANILEDAASANSAEQLKKAYYSLALVDAYYNRALQYLKNEQLRDSIKERKALNDRDTAMVRGKLTRLESGSERYMKAADLEAECVVNFQSAGELLMAGDHDGVKKILDENNGLAAELKALNSAEAEGIESMVRAYSALNDIFSQPPEGKRWTKASIASLANRLSACVTDLGNAKSRLADRALSGISSDLMDRVSKMHKDVKEAGEKL